MLQRENKAPMPWPPAGLPVYYADEWTCLVHGDALEVLPLLTEQSVNLIVTDPPYFRVKSAWWDQQWQTPAAYLAWIARLCQQWRRVLMQNGSVYCFASPEMATEVEGTLKRWLHVLNRITWQKDDGWHQKAVKEALHSYLSPWEAIIFAEHPVQTPEYEQAPDGVRGHVFESLRAYLDHERRRAGIRFEDVRQMVGCAAGSGLPSHWFSKAQWQLPTAEHYGKLQRGFNKGHTAEYLRQEYEDLRRPFALTATDQWSDVWRFPTVAPGPGKHPCEKPLRLLSQIIRASSRPGDMLLDCCAGSGSLLEAAKQLGRRSLGIEIEERSCAMAVQRLRQEVLPLGETAQLALFSEPVASAENGP